MDKAIQEQIDQVLSKLDWSLTPEQIDRRTKDIINSTLKAIENVESIAPENRTFQNTMEELERIVAEAGDRFASVYFPSYVSTDPEIRKASSNAVKEYRKFMIELSMRKSLYEAVKPLEAQKDKFNPVERRLLERYLRDFRRMGLDLPEKEQNELKSLLQRMSQLSVEFQQTLNEITDTVVFSPEEMDGIPPNTLESYRKDENGNYIVGMSYPEVFPVMEYAKNPETRRKLMLVYGNRGVAQGNVERLEEMIQLRAKAAKIRGYANHAEYVLEERMAKHPDNVFDFLNDLENKLKPFGHKDLDTLQKLKAKDQPEDQQIKEYDFQYYIRKHLEEEYRIDKEEIKQYFPMEHTVNEMLNFYQYIFGFTFTELQDANKWHEDVKVYAVQDTETKEFRGIFFLDLFPRDGKYNHAAAFTLIKGRMENGAHVPTASAMVTNFNKPTENKPSLLTHAQVNTLFHEFGHIIHQVTTRSRFYTFSGSSVSRDFVEAPSQMLENWVWEPVVLNRISKHFETGQPLPESLLNKMLRAKNAMASLKYLRQIFFGKFDMTAHTQDKIDSASLWHKLRKEITLIPSTEGTNPAASFGHIMGGYDAGYYGYLWSEVFAQDMYSRFEKEGPTSRQVGMEYRRFILEPGNDIEEEELLRRYLGREPNNEAFLKSLGLKP
ncbi:MAG: hypothetical protein D6732_15215 [Methanobacteriota archaeon]|nr:MAG: hypothetical protein D6732_15215 [Euryarchaeota archaeon]